MHASLVRFAFADAQFENEKPFTHSQHPLLPDVSFYFILFRTFSPQKNCFPATSRMI
jgi:hypothetical protein